MVLALAALAALAAQPAVGVHAGSRCAGVLTAQEPVGPDTVRVGADTVAQDTAAQDTAAADTAAPPPTLPAMGRPGPAGWSLGVWEWERQDLLRLPDLSLLQLLERVPGLNPVRAGILGQPESGAVFGAAAGAIRYVFDGFALDPLTTPTFDPSRLALLALERVRVERGVTGATVHLETLTPSDARSHSVVEAATGDLDINLFRGTFLAPRVLGGSLGVGFERLATDVAAGSNHLGGWVKWTFVRDSSGVQLELRQSDMDRSGVGPALEGGRRDWAIRARTRLGPVTGEAYAGASSVEDELGSVVLREGSPQGGVRLASRLEAPVLLETTAALRLRSHPRLPRQELELSAWAAPAPWLGVGVDVAQGWWEGPETTGRWSVKGRVGPVLGVSAFAGVFEGGPLLGEGASELRVPGFGPEGTLRIDRSGERAGVEAGWGGLRLGAAAVRTRAGSSPGFGLAFDSTAPNFGAVQAEGFDAHARIPTFWSPLWLEGWYVGMDRPQGWLYLPRDQWRAALVYHHFPLPSGNLELYARVEHVFRGAMAVPAYGAAGSGAGEAGEGEALPAAAGGAVLAEAPRYRSTNLELVIRVLGVRAFVRWENLMHRLLQRDLVGSETYYLPGQHILYGVKWEFWN